MSRPAKPRSMQSYLIYVTVTFTFGVPKYAYSFYPGSDDASSATVNPGDQVAWYVVVFANNVLSYPAYELTFAEPSFFGRGSLSVPAGGHSPYIPVHALSLANTKYTLRVSGISPADDPVMQTDPGGPLVINLVPVDYQILWDQNGVVWLVGQPNTPMPAVLPVKYKDTVTFLSQPANTFGAVFDLNPAHQTLLTPFTSVQTGVSTILGDTPAGGAESTGKKDVQHDPDANTSFVFRFKDGIKADSNPYTIQIAQAADGHKPRQNHPGA